MPSESLDLIAPLDSLNHIRVGLTVPATEIPDHLALKPTLLVPNGGHEAVVAIGLAVTFLDSVAGQLSIRGSDFPVAFQERELLLKEMGVHGRKVVGGHNYSNTLSTNQSRGSAFVSGKGIVSREP